METQRIVYNDRITRMFIWASVLWGIVGMLVGAIVALQLAFWPANFEPYLTFGRLRPLHTNAVIFAFVGNMLFAGVYYSTQRLCKVRNPSDLLANVHFWGWQAIIVSAAITLPLGITTSKEYAELEWPIDLAITAIWVVFAVNFFWTLAKRNEKHLYVAIWFYIATILAVAVLHIVNSLAIPAGLFKSYSVFGGVQDALVQWWYGHNAVAFFLTTPILGIMYYFVPKAAERPVFSYRLSIIHFWSLVFIYIWAGPHHLLNTALPDWAQTLGMIFSLMLWAPSWGGMLNGLLTLRGAWDKLRTDPVLKFFAAGVTFYGMSTFEGPLLSIKAVSSLAHYTDWIIGHVHSGALGWNGLMAAGMFYWLIPRLYGTKLHSRGAANFHFWTGTFGIMIYVVAMWVSGITQGLMWRELNPGGGLAYPNFVETVIKIIPLYWLRLVGGTIYLLGFILMAWNLIMTARSGKPVEGEAEVPVGAIVDPEEAKIGWVEVLLGKPVILTFVVGGIISLLAIGSEVANTFLILAAFGVALIGAIALGLSKPEAGRPPWHRLLEGKAGAFTILTALGVLAGGIAEIVPMVMAVPEQTATTSNSPYHPLELEGRDVYLAEGCYTCHSQMIRPFTWETARYGDVSEMDDSVFDHPFQWGSKRTGPDLARVGGKYSHLWHYRHLMNPREITPGSNMPNYTHLPEQRIDYGDTATKMRALRSVGVPYEPAEIAGSEQAAMTMANSIVAELEQEGVPGVDPNSKMVALISYLQRLGRPPAQGVPAAPGEDTVEVSMAGEAAPDAAGSQSAEAR
ncbi:MAG TPA: cytochrome-c oxidase, cbb3-type subunit I [Polyangiaceae bacterium LLY-WYZ-14_1]|nr:cytochrome-c oxidase, cbb3-type subunit I [Polyangiaceae bacterium LLY-WYZ-14_1]